MDVKMEFDPSERKVVRIRKQNTSSRAKAPDGQPNQVVATTTAPRTVFLKQVTPKGQQGQAQPVTLRGANGNSYEIKGIVHSNQTYQNSSGRKVIAVVNKNGSNNYQKIGTKTIVSVNGQVNGQIKQPIYATLNSVKSENGGQPNAEQSQNGQAVRATRNGSPTEL